MQGVWTRNTARYSSGEIYKIGHVRVGSWFNPTVSKGEPQKFRAVVELPGIAMKEGTDTFDNAEAARKRVEAVVATWFKWLEQA
jgi:hypothetical protein